jgi:hypothetical protein
MRNLFILLFVGCLFFSCKSETPKGEKCEAIISIHKVYNSTDLMEKIMVVMPENDSVGQLIVTDLAEANGYLPVIETKDTAIVRSYIAKLNFDKPTTCTFLPIIKPTGEELNSLIVYEQVPLISETVTLSISPRENQEYEAMFKFANANEWERITQENVGHQLALAVNGVIKSAPTVTTPIEGGRCSVIGHDLDKLLK